MNAITAGETAGDTDSPHGPVIGGGAWPNNGPRIYLHGRQDGYGLYAVAGSHGVDDLLGHREATARFVALARVLAEDLPAETWQPALCRAWLLAMAADAEARLRRLELGDAIRSAWDELRDGRKVSALAETLGVHRDTVYAVANGEAWT